VTATWPWPVRCRRVGDRGRWADGRRSLVTLRRRLSGGPRPDEDALVSTLLDRAASQPGPAMALFHEFDDDLLFASRRREQLS
jgi:hypothetical protein